MALTKVTQTVIATGAISSSQIANGSITADHLTGVNTDHVSEGSTNVYFSNARARSSLSGSTGVTYDSSSGAISIGQAVGTSDSVAFGQVTVDNLTINGYEIDSDTDFIIDAVGDINLDADGGDIRFKDGGIEFYKIAKNGDHVQLFSTIQDGDLTFNGFDGSSHIVALTLDMSSQGDAIFNNDILLGDGNPIRFGDDQDLRMWFDGNHGIIQNTTSNSDIYIKGNDGGSTITMLNFDTSNLGKATFSGDIITPGSIAASSDASQIQLGSGNRAQIFHNSAGLYMRTSTGPVYAQADSFRHLASDASTDYLVSTSTALTVNSGVIRGPSTLTIDPATHGNNTGTVVIAGDLQVDGTTTTINSTTVNIDDLNIQLATGAANAAAANGAGITVDGANATITYNGTLDTWDFNKELRLTTGSFASHVNGNRYIKYRSTYDSAAVADFELKSDNNSAAVARITSTGTADVLQVFDNTTQVFTIADGGKVGIGLQGPNYPLEVAGPGTVSFAYQRTGVSGPKKWGFHSDSSNTYWQNVTDGTLALTVSNTGRIGTGGNLGPESALHIEHTTDAHGIIIDHKTVGGFSDILFRTKNNASSQIAMNRIRSDMIDGSTGLEDSELTIFGMNDGNEKVGLVLSRTASTYISAFTTFADYSDTSNSSNYFELGTWAAGSSSRITIRINGANSYSNGFDPAGETVIHGTITNLPDFEGFFYGVTSYGSIPNVAVKQNGSNYTIYVLPGTYSSYEAHVTITHDSNWVPKHAGADTGSTSAPSGSVQLQSLYSVSTAGQRRLTITSGGSVGIGNSGPTALLHLGSSAMTTNPVGIGIQNNTRYYALEVNSSALRIKDVSAGGIERVRLTSGGKLAIGDIATAGDPNRYLSVYSPSTQSSGFNDIAEFLAPSQTGGGVSVNFGIANSTKNVGKIVFNYSSSGSNDNNIGLGFYDADNLMVIKANGKVGIGGTVMEGQTLNIEGWAQSNTRTPANAWLIGRGTGGDGLAIGTSATTPYATWFQSGYLPTMGTSNHYALSFNPHGGNVGIGQASPAETLHIGSGQSNYIRIHNAASGDIASGLTITRGGSAGLALYDNPADDTTTFSAIGNINFRTDNTSYRLYIKDNGQVLIGSNPANNRTRKVTIEGTGDLLQLYSTNTGASGAQLDLTQDSSSKADGDLVGRVLFSTDVRQYANVHGVASNHAGEGELHLGVRESSSVYNSDAAIINNKGRFQSTGYKNNTVESWIITGSYTQNTWYTLTDRASMINLGFGDGIYQFHCYASTFHAGISLYTTNHIYEQFYLLNVASNGASTHEFRRGPAFGHAVNSGHDAIGLRYRETYGGAQGGPLIEWSPKAAGLSNLSTSAGYQLYFYLRRVG